jgi:lantibiotic modifying enzyme
MTGPDLNDRIRPECSPADPRGPDPAVTDVAARYLDAAQAAGQWLISVAVRGTTGLSWPAWPDGPDGVDPGFYHGGAGVAWFLTELASATGSAEFAAAARQAALFTARLPREGRYGLFSGLAGATLAVRHTATALDDARLRATADGMLADLMAAAQQTGAGLEWPPFSDGRGPWQELYHGTAGIALVLAELGRPDAALAAGRRLAELAIAAPPGCWWKSRPQDFRPAPNIAHGTAGISCALASLAALTGDAGLAERATDGARYLLSIARTTDGTCAVYHHEADGTDLYTLGWCSGPPGLACLFVRLHQLTGEAGWLDWARRAARTVTGSGLPARLYPGFWDNVGQCCGSAGVADFFHGLHGLTGDQAYLQFAQAVLDDVLDRAVRDQHGARWHNIEHTADPPELPAATGWMQGASGVGAALLRGYLIASGQPAGRWLPGWPFAG